MTEDGAERRGPGATTRPWPGRLAVARWLSGDPMLTGGTGARAVANTHGPQQPQQPEPEPTAKPIGQPRAHGVPEGQPRGVETSNKTPQKCGAEMSGDPDGVNALEQHQARG